MKTPERLNREAPVFFHECRSESPFPDQPFDLQPQSFAKGHVGKPDARGLQLVKIIAAMAKISAVLGMDSQIAFLWNGLIMDGDVQQLAHDLVVLPVGDHIGAANAEDLLHAGGHLKAVHHDTGQIRTIDRVDQVLISAAHEAHRSALTEHRDQILLPCLLWIGTQLRAGSEDMSRSEDGPPKGCGALVQKHKLHLTLLRAIQPVCQVHIRIFILGYSFVVRMIDRIGGDDHQSVCDLAQNADIVPGLLSGVADAVQDRIPVTAFHSGGKGINIVSVRCQGVDLWPHRSVSAGQTPYLMASPECFIRRVTANKAASADDKNLHDRFLPVIYDSIRIRDPVA